MPGNKACANCITGTNYKPTNSVYNKEKDMATDEQLFGIGVAPFIIIIMIGMIIAYLCFSWLRTIFDAKMRERKMDKYKHEFYLAREEEMKILFQKSIAIGRPIEEKVPMMSA